MSIPILKYYHEKIKPIIDGKVNKEDGKGLSTNDLTDELLEIINSDPEYASDAGTVNGHTVLSDVPANAVFTDTHYTSKNVVHESETGTENTGGSLMTGAHLNHVENGIVTSSHELVGAGMSQVWYSAADKQIIVKTEPDLTKFGITATATELNYMDGVTSNVQTQLDSKFDSSFKKISASASFGGVTGTSGTSNISVTKPCNGVMLARIILTSNFSMNSYVSSGTTNVTISTIYDPSGSATALKILGGTILTVNSATSTSSLSDINLNNVTGNTSFCISYTTSTKYNVTVDLLCLLFTEPSA